MDNFNKYGDNPEKNKNLGDDTGDYSTSEITKKSFARNFDNADYDQMLKEQEEFLKSLDAQFSGLGNKPAATTEESIGDLEKDIDVAVKTIEQTVKEFYRELSSGTTPVVDDEETVPQTNDPEEKHYYEPVINETSIEDEIVDQISENDFEDERD